MPVYGLFQVSAKKCCIVPNKHLWLISHHSRCTDEWRPTAPTPSTLPAAVFPQKSTKTKSQICKMKFEMHIPQRISWLLVAVSNNTYRVTPLNWLKKERKQTNNSDFNFSHFRVPTLGVMFRFAINCPKDVSSTPMGHVYKTCSW